MTCQQQELSGTGSKIKLMIVGDNQLLEQCLAVALTDFECTCVDSSSLTSAGNSLRIHQPDVVILTSVPSRQEVSERLRILENRFPEAKRIVLGTSSDKADILHQIESGAHGNVSRDASIHQLKEAIHRALSGEVVYPEPVIWSLFPHLPKLASEVGRYRDFDDFNLSPREFEVLELIADGLSNRQIADRLILSLYTVKNHVHRILEKLDVGSRVEAVKSASRKGWLASRNVPVVCQTSMT